MLVDNRILIASRRFRFGVADDENGLGVLQDAGDGRQCVVGRVDF
jgi:hypothetical protein